MSTRIQAIGADRLADYATVPSVFEVRSMFDIEEIDGGAGGFNLRERPVLTPYIKNYDANGDDSPLTYPKRFAISRWGFWLARENGVAIGGAAVAWDTANCEMLEGRTDLAVLWDIRVRASHRKQGVGAALFGQAARWAKAKGCRAMKVETQNVNVGACRFYARMGRVLDRIDRHPVFFSPELIQAGEILMLWRLDL